MSSDPTGASAVAPDPEATPPDPPARRTRPPGPKISSHEALAIATADGTPVYGGLSHFRVEIVLEADGWVAHRAHYPPTPGPVHRRRRSALCHRRHYGPDRLEEVLPVTLLPRTTQ